MESCTQALSILSRVWKVVLKLLSILSRVWKVILDTRLIVEYFARYRTHTRVEYGKLYSSYEYVESSMGSCTQALSILSRVWEVVLKL